MRFPVFSSLLLTAVCAVSVAAQTVTGTVTNRTVNKASAGDTVTLVRLTQTMQDAGSTTTDARGHYKLAIADNDQVHLLRVTHQKANYFQPLPSGTTTANVDVYDVSEKVEGVETNVVELHVEAKATELRVVEIIQVLNQSSPQRTQFGPKGFDFYIPAEARISRTTAFRDELPVPAAASPVGDPGHYTFLFPLRPGDTTFAIVYSLPYTGSYTLEPKLTGPVNNFAVIAPLSMRVTPGRSTSYTQPRDATDRQTFMSRSVTAGSPLTLAITGTGELPADKDSAQSPAAPKQSADGTIPATENTMPGKGLDNPLDPEGTRDPWSKYKWWILSGLLAALAIAAGVLLRKPAALPAGYEPASDRPPASEDDRMLMALKEEMFALETERLQGGLPEGDYVAQKAALEVVLKRALARRAAGKRVA